MIAAYARELIAPNDFHGDQATLDVHLAAMEHIVAAAEESGVSGELPRLVRDLTARAVAAGHAQRRSPRSSRPSDAPDLQTR